MGEPSGGVPRLTQEHTDLRRMHWPDLALARCDLATSADKKEINLYSKLYQGEKDVSLSVYSPPASNHRIPYTEAIQGAFTPSKTGTTFKGSWLTHWFHVQAVIPEHWYGKEIHLLWNSHCEALVFKDGTPVQGFAGTDGDDHRYQYIITRNADKSNATVDLYVEMACNGLFGNGQGGGWGGIGPNPTDLDKSFTLDQACLAVFNRAAYETLVDFIVITDMARHFPKESQHKSDALQCANHMLNVFRLEDETTWQEVREIAGRFLSQRNGERAHNITALGHCHIDTAWLWSFDETKRKCARSWATQLELMRDYPEHRFACSQAQQFDWVKTLYPQLYTRIKEHVKSGQFIPCGGTWVEMDCNIPSGESLSRQFLYGQHFFQEEFGSICDEFWLPDTFGYAAQLPQICRLAGIKYFLTQKLSWNQVNKFPHHTFVWEGLDGSQVVTHFPPADNYCAQANVKELLHSVSNFKDRETSHESLMLFGFGDGGGGPTPLMLDKLRRVTDCDGMPRVQLRPLSDFWSRLTGDAQGKMNLWVGELYFEYHRGTYTSQARTKLNNRQCEVLLHQVELLATMTCVLLPNSGYVYPQAEIDRLWKLVLLNQFHDVIPGSSITEVYEDAEKYYEDVRQSATALYTAALDVLAPAAIGSSSSSKVIVNTLPWSRQEVVGEGESKCLVSVAACSMGGEEVQPDHPVQVTEEKADGNILYTLSNGHIDATIDKRGRVLSLSCQGQPSVIDSKNPGNVFAMFEDTPMYWDAWDVDIYHLAKRTLVRPASLSPVKVHQDELSASLSLGFSISTTSMVNLTIRLDANSDHLDFDLDVKWNENHQFLKVEFPLDIRTSKATYEIQYGHVERPTHFNTSHDIAKFEVCAQRWCDVSEYGRGVALINDCKYGHAVHGNVLRLSLLRSPKNPDPTCDIGRHRIRYALVPHKGSLHTARVPELAAAFNEPLSLSPERAVSNLSVQQPFIHCVDTNNPVYIDAVKLAQDGSGDVIVRVYEHHGGRVKTWLSGHIVSRCQAVTLVNTLEERMSVEAQAEAARIVKGDQGLSIELSPFQIQTLRFSM